VYPALFVFDMIGTTVEPSAAIPEAFRRALAGSGVNLADEDIASVRGKSKREAIAELLPGAVNTGKQERVYARFKALLDDHYRAGGAKALDGAIETFEWCRSIGARTALTTGFDSDIAKLLIDSLDWSQAVDTFVCNDDVPEGRPAPFLIEKAMASQGIDDPGSVASIGDTLSDLQAGLNAGVGWNFGVLSGAHDEARLAGVGNAIILPGVAALPQYDWS
jgi:phosphonatase-like hydrolase